MHDQNMLKPSLQKISKKKTNTDLIFIFLQNNYTIPRNSLNVLSWFH